MKVAEVIPYIRTPRGKDYFDYTVPDDISLQRGTIVRVPFRSGTIDGLVRAIKKETGLTALKPIESVAVRTDWNDEGRLQLLEWMSSYYCISQASAFKIMHELFPIRSPWRNDHAIEAQRSTLSPLLPEVLCANNRAKIIAHYNTIHAKARGHILCIVPESRHAQEIADGLNQNIHSLVLNSNRGKKETEQLFHTLTQRTEPLFVIGTKKNIFLPAQYFETLIVDQEEEKSHKQFDQNPRYHVRDVAMSIYRIQAKTAHPLQLVYSSYAPSLELYHWSTQGKVRWSESSQRKRQHEIRVMNMEDEYNKGNYTWFSEQLIEAVQTHRKTVLFLNRMSKNSIVVCRECGELVQANAKQCSHCFGTELVTRRKGTHELESELKRLFPKKKILRIDSESVDATETVDLSDTDIVIATEKIFRVVSLNTFDCLGILSIDHLLLYPHFRSHERVFQLLSQLFAVDIDTIVQTHSPSHPVITTAIQHTYQQFADEELRIRKQLQLPPIAPQYVLINTRTGEREIAQTLSAETLPANIVVDRL